MDCEDCAAMLARDAGHDFTADEIHAFAVKFGIERDDSKIDLLKLAAACVKEIR